MLPFDDYPGLYAPAHVNGCPLRTVRAELHARLARRSWLRRQRRRQAAVRYELVEVVGRRLRQRLKMCAVDQQNCPPSTGVCRRQYKKWRVAYGLRQRPLVCGALPRDKFCWCPRTINRTARRLWQHCRRIRWTITSDCLGENLPCIAKCVTIQEFDSPLSSPGHPADKAIEHHLLAPAVIAATLYARGRVRRQPKLSESETAEVWAWLRPSEGDGSEVLALSRGIPLTREKLRWVALASLLTAFLPSISITSYFSYLSRRIAWNG